MQILSDQEIITDQVVVTLGNFDGVHLGHQALIQEAKKLATERKEKFLLITFENHPSEILNPQHSTKLICSLPFKLKLIEDLNVDYLLLLRFTKELRNQTTSQFLTYLKEKIPFTQLVLGYDSTLGREREGSQKIVEALAKSLNFTVTYLPPLKIDDNIISSRLIRSLIQEGKLKKAEKLLGRPFSIYAIPTTDFTFDLSELVMPPKGIYNVQVQSHGKSWQGTAYIKENNFLKVNLREYEGGIDFQNQYLKIIFY